MRILPVPEVIWSNHSGAWDGFKALQFSPFIHLNLILRVLCPLATRLNEFFEPLHVKVLQFISFLESII